MGATGPSTPWSMSLQECAENCMHRCSCSILPRLNQVPISMHMPPLSCRYVNVPHNKAGTQLKVVVRGKKNDAVVTKMPFVKTTYYKPS